MNSDDDKKGAAVKFPPPLIFLLLMIAAYGIHYFWPMSIGSFSELKTIGIILFVFALSLVILVSLVFRKVKTNIEPWKPTTSIISTGIFSYSRNPIYLAFCIAAIGVGIFLNSLWIVFSVIPSSICVYYIAIKKEEVYLEGKFGEEYLEYKNKVRRWI